MIDKTKQYRTRDGRAVRIYATDGYGACPIHGAIKYEAGWRNCSWSINGEFNPYTHTEGVDDLIEVKPRIKRTVWLNIYPEKSRSATIIQPDKNRADAYAAEDRIACIKVEIDCEHGEGL